MCSRVQFMIHCVCVRVRACMRVIDCYALARDMIMKVYRRLPIEFSFFPLY
jgi:hypothetical protein